MNFTPTMEGDPPELGAEGILLMNELARAYERIDKASPLCSETKPSFQEAEKYTYARHNRDGTRRTEDRFKCYGFKKPGSGDVAHHVRAGFALTDLYCDNFFRRIAKHASQRRFARNTTNDVGAAVTAVLGLARAGSAIAGGAGTAFGLVDGGFRNYDDNFLVTPDLQVLQPKVYSEQDKIRKEVYKNMPNNYFDANSAIIRYANVCSYTGMKALLNEAVVKSTEPTTIAETVRQFQVDAATQKELLDAEIAERKADLAEAERDAAKREKDAVEAREALENEPGGD